MVRKAYLPLPKQNKMPKLWDYDYHKQETWPWIDCTVAGVEERYISAWIKNPAFQHGHLIDGYDSLKSDTA